MLISYLNKRVILKTFDDFCLELWLMTSHFEIIVLIDHLFMIMMTIYASIRM